MKKLFSLLVATIMVMIVTATSALADGNWLSKTDNAKAHQAVVKGEKEQFFKILRESSEKAREEGYDFFDAGVWEDAKKKKVYIDVVVEHTQKDVELLAAYNILREVEEFRALLLEKKKGAAPSSRIANMNRVLIYVGYDLLILRGMKNMQAVWYDDYAPNPKKGQIEIYLADGIYKKERVKNIVKKAITDIEKLPRSN